MTSPGSSESEERLLLKQEAAGSSPAPGSTYLYAVVRKDFNAATFVVQFGHALTECLEPQDVPLPNDTRMVVLGASKEEMAKVRFDLDAAEVHHSVVVETDGPLAGVTTAIGLLTRDRDELKLKVPLLGELKRWKEPKLASDAVMVPRAVLEQVEHEDQCPVNRMGSGAGPCDCVMLEIDKLLGRQSK